MSKQVTGRFSPTPSGALHLGNIFCAMLAYLSARSQGGNFLLRIEDVDVPRCPRKLAEQCIADLRWFGFRWDAEPVYQSERGELYGAALDVLQNKGLIYPCFCTRAELHSLQAPNLGDGMVVYPGTCRNLTQAQQLEKQRLRKPSLRLKVPDSTESFHDGLYGDVSIRLADQCGDCILRRSDGLYSYQLAVVVDDALSGVTEIIRGRDIMTATGWHLFLQESLGYSTPKYIHVPLLTDSNGRRLAKRDKDLSIEMLSKRYTANEILGFLAYAAGILKEPEPVTLEELIPHFQWSKIKKEDVRLPEQLTQ